MSEAKFLPNFRFKPKFKVIKRDKRWARKYHELYNESLMEKLKNFGNLSRS